jgi:hypothetical protein
MTRLLSLVFVLTAAVQAQVQIGIEAGVPLTNTFSTSQIGPYVGNGSFLEDAYSSQTKRLLIGPTIRVGLPLGLGLQFDALYQRVNYEGTYISAGGESSAEYFSHNTANRWQFPLLAQYKLKVPLFKPFVEVGPTLSHIFNGHNTLDLFNDVFGSQSLSTSEVDKLAELRHSTVFGAAVGLGVDLHVRFLHIRPEFRYVRWVSSQFSAASPYSANDLLTVMSIPTNLPLPAVGQPSISSKRNEVSFLLGITF